MVGIYIVIDVSMMSAENNENPNSWMWYALIIKVVFSQQKLKCKLHVFCLAPKVTGQPIQYFCFALPRSKFLTAFFVLYLVIFHW